MPSAASWASSLGLSSPDYMTESPDVSVGSRPLYPGIGDRHRDFDDFRQVTGGVLYPEESIPHCGRDPS
jgi:hypothetical protein